MTLRSTAAALAIGALVAACRAQVPEAAERPQEAAPVDTSTVLVSADWLATLPEGEEKRWLVLQCTGCHAIDDTILMVDGSPRTRASWVESIRRMMAFSGADTDFPILSRSLDPEAMADFLVEHAPTAIPAARPIELVNERRAMSPEMALRLGRFFGNGTELWMGMQTRFDLWGVENDPEALREARRIEPALA